MLRSRLFWKLFLGFTSVNLLTAVALVSATWAWQRDEATALTERELATAGALIAEAAEAWIADPTEPNAAELDRLARRAQVDIEVSAPGGRSHRVALHDEIGARAGPLNVRHRINLESGGRMWLQRPGETLAATLSNLWARYAFYAPVVMLVMVAAGYGLVAHLVGPVRALSRAAASMAHGDYAQRAFIGNRDELGELARLFNSMSAELGARLSELQESDRRQATVLGGMIEGVIAIDDRSRVLLANPAAGEQFGFPPAQAVGRPLIEAIRNDALHQAVKASISSRSPQRLEVNWDDRIFSVQVTPLLGGTAAGAVVVLHDTTELRRLENLRRDFVANVSHELKTPLSTVKANAETLLRGAMDDSEVRVRFLDGIVEQSERLADLIQDMLNLARIESAQQPFEIQPISVASAVEACLRDYEQRAEAKNIALATADSNGHASAQVKADPEGLRVILNNLVDNAIKYTPKGGSVRVSWGPDTEAQSQMVTIEVADTGVGIPEGKLPRVFERFYRVDEARSPHLGGTGLGLSIVKHLAQSFGGGVAAESGEDGGATFAVTLPAA